jgi:hypothetical protein
VPPEDQPSLRLVVPDELEDVSPEVVVTVVLAAVAWPECAATTANPPVAAIPSRPAPSAARRAVVLGSLVMVLLVVGRRFRAGT